MGLSRRNPLSARPLTPAKVWSLTSLTRLAWLTGLCVLLLAAGSLAARASVALLLEQPYGGLGRVNPTGHTALYFDQICAATPVQLRPCRPGELGVVISRYDGIAHRDWIAIPLLPYLYAVESSADIPESIDRAQETTLRDNYRRRALETIAPDRPDGNPPEGNWYELAGSAYDRTIYGFSVKTTPEQNEALIALFNDRRNVERYNGAFRNCADFVRSTINRIYPHAVRRSFVADFGLMTPKQAARSLTRYAFRHPDLELRAFIIPQVKGSLPRSHATEGITESLIKRYGIPLTVLSPVATAVVFVAYMGHGRFDMPQDAPVIDLRSQGGVEDLAFLSSGAAEPAPAPAMAPPPAPSESPLLVEPASSPFTDSPLPSSFLRFSTTE